MGKTNPTYRQLLDKWIDEWKYFREGLRNDWPEAFDELMDGAKQHADAASYSNPVGPQEIESHALISICLEQQRQLRDLDCRISELEPSTNE